MHDSDAISTHSKAGISLGYPVKDWLPVKGHLEEGLLKSMQEEILICMKTPAVTDINSWTLKQKSTVMEVNMFPHPLSGFASSALT